MRRDHLSRIWAYLLAFLLAGCATCPERPLDVPQVSAPVGMLVRFAPEGLPLYACSERDGTLYCVDLEWFLKETRTE